jgi:hypothetical protein
MLTAFPESPAGLFYPKGNGPTGLLLKPSHRSQASGEFARQFSRPRRASAQAGALVKIDADGVGSSSILG